MNCILEVFLTFGGAVYFCHTRFSVFGEGSLVLFCIYVSNGKYYIVSLQLMDVV